MPEFAVRLMSAEDVAGAVRLQRACFPPPFPEDLLWTEDHLLAHLRIFPEGQFIAVAESLVVGSASNCIVSEETWSSHVSWDATVGGPWMANHDAGGSTLYGVDVSVHPDWRGRGVMRALYQARFDLVARMRLKRYGTAVRIPGFAAYELQTLGSTPEDYVRAVSEGLVVDRTLTPMLRVGLVPGGVITDYMEDPESHNAAAVLEWRP